MKNVLSSAHVYSRTTPMFLNTTLGKYVQRHDFASKAWEHTRLRKKPSGAGERILTDAREVFEFNAWYKMNRKLTNSYKICKIAIFTGITLNGMWNRSRRLCPQSKRIRLLR